MMVAYKATTLDSFSERRQEHTGSQKPRYRAGADRLRYLRYLSHHLHRHAP